MVKCKYGELVRPVTLPSGRKRRCKLKPLQCYIYANNWTRGNQY